MTSRSAYKRPFGAPSCNPNYTSTFRSPFVSSNCFFSPAVLIWASQRASSFSTSARQFNVSCSMASARRSMAFFLSSRSKFIRSRLESKISIGQTLNCTEVPAVYSTHLQAPYSIGIKTGPRLLIGDPRAGY